VRYRPDAQGMAARVALERIGGKLLENDPLGAILPPRIPTPYTLVFRVPYRSASGSLTLIVHEPGFLLHGEGVVALQ